jgi:lipopolysaccharide biosynthesis glycosyltransferase
MIYKVAIGFEPAETVAFWVAAHSLMRHSSQPVSIIPINKANIPEFTRGLEDGSTQFSFSRFLTPWLCGYQGQAMFVDSDFLFRCDVVEVFNLCKGDKDVFVCKADYTPKTTEKFLGNKQHLYPKKNWSSLMVFNCHADACQNLTPDAVNTASGKYLHQMQWTTEDRVGSLPIEYNHLVGEYEPNTNAKIVHHTLGSPCFNEYRDQEFADEWFEERERMLYALNKSVGSA